MFYYLLIAVFTLFAIMAIGFGLGFLIVWWSDNRRERW